MKGMEGKGERKTANHKQTDYKATLGCNVTHCKNPQPSLHCNTEHNPQEQETGKFPYGNKYSSINHGPGPTAQGWLKDWGIIEFSDVYLGLVEKQ